MLELGSALWGRRWVTVQGKPDEGQGTHAITQCLTQGAEHLTNSSLLSRRTGSLQDQVSCH